MGYWIGALIPLPVVLIVSNDPLKLLLALLIIHPIFYAGLYYLMEYLERKIKR